MTSTPTPSPEESSAVAPDPVGAIREALAAGPTPGIWEMRSGKRWHHVVADRQMFGNLENWRCVAVADEDGDLCAQDAAFIAACNPVAIAALLAQLEAAQRQHHRDSAELRILCEARDSARRERDLTRVEVASLEASVGHLSRLVDELRPAADRYGYLRARDLSAIDQGGLFAGKTPDNLVLNGDDLDEAIDAALAEQQEGDACAR